MNKEYSKMNDKDRIICVTEAVPASISVHKKNKYKCSGYRKYIHLGKHTFYYQPTGASRRIALFSTKRYSPSIADFFAGKGVLVCDGRTNQTYSITFGELCRMRNYHHNHVLDKLLARLSACIKNVARNEMDEPMVNPSEYHGSACRTASRSWDDDRVA